MILRLARWSPRRLYAVWGVGILIEAALLSVMFVLLVPPEPDLVERLGGERRGGSVEIFVPVSGAAPDDAAIHRGKALPAAAEESFYTVLHWPLNKPLLAGGGRVVAVPMRFWWVPVLYVGAIPLLLACITGAWLWARRQPRSTGSSA